MLDSLHIMLAPALRKRLNDSIMIGLIHFNADKLKGYALDSGLIEFDTAQGSYDDILPRSEK